MANLFLRLVAFLSRTAVSLATAVSIRWLLCLGSPADDIATLRQFFASIKQAFTLPDYREGVNMAYLAGMRRRVDIGAYDADMFASDTLGDYRYAADNTGTSTGTEPDTESNDRPSNDY